MVDHPAFIIEAQYVGPPDGWMVHWKLKPAWDEVELHRTTRDYIRMKNAFQSAVDFERDSYARRN